MRLEALDISSCSSRRSDFCFSNTRRFSLILPAGFGRRFVGAPCQRGQFQQMASRREPKTGWRGNPQNTRAHFRFFFLSARPSTSSKSSPNFEKFFSTSTALAKTSWHLWSFWSTFWPRDLIPSCALAMSACHKTSGWVAWRLLDGFRGLQSGCSRGFLAESFPLLGIPPKLPLIKLSGTQFNRSAEPQEPLGPPPQTLRTSSPNHTWKHPEPSIWRPHGIQHRQQEKRRIWRCLQGAMQSIGVPVTATESKTSKNQMLRNQQQRWDS